MTLSRSWKTKRSLSMYVCVVERMHRAPLELVSGAELNASVPFQYCKRMREDGTWGGNQELYAAARNFQVYVVIHQENSRMVIECDAQKPREILHVAYHGSDHYDSVRAIQDFNLNEPPQAIVLDCDGFRPDDLAKVRSDTHRYCATNFFRDD